jgi:hypothetical protein
MKRTQIYVTAEQDARIAKRAKELGVSKAEVIRQALEDALGVTGNAETEAKEILEATSGVLADYPDWEEWLASVRGRTSDERLRALGM